MAYEIPQALKYEEKIIFGLSLRQLAYFGGAAVAVAVIFKTTLPLMIKIPISVMMLSLCSALAFLNLDKKLLELFRFHTSKKHMGYFNSELSKIIGVADISNSFVLLHDNSVIGILQVTPTNFSIKAARDKEAIIKNYQNFLNSLDFPIQILVRTVNVNLDFYLEHLCSAIKKLVEKRKNSGLEKLFNDYTAFIELYIDANAVKNKLFYVIVKGGVLSKNKEQREKTLSELESRLSLCRDNLAACGLPSKRLNTEGLTSLMSSFFGCSVNVESAYTSPLTVFRRKNG